MVLYMHFHGLKELAKRCSMIILVVYYLIKVKPG